MTLGRLAPNQVTGNATMRHPFFLNASLLTFPMANFSSVAPDVGERKNKKDEINREKLGIMTAF